MPTHTQKVLCSEHSVNALNFFFCISALTHCLCVLTDDGWKGVDIQERISMATDLEGMIQIPADPTGSLLSESQGKCLGLRQSRLVLKEFDA